MPKRRRIGVLKYLASRSPSPADTAISDRTIKGKREGIIVLAHKSSPFFIYSIAISEFLKKRAKIKQIMAIDAKDEKERLFL